MKLKVMNRTGPKQSIVYSNDAGTAFCVSNLPSQCPVNSKETRNENLMRTSDTTPIPIFLLLKNKTKFSKSLIHFQSLRFDFHISSNIYVLNCKGKQQWMKYAQNPFLSIIYFQNFSLLILDQQSEGMTANRKVCFRQTKARILFYS